ncbi:MAG: hypothetical protein R6U39_01095 [Candidatus Aegiribacteria sp.]
MTPLLLSIGFSLLLLVGLLLLLRARFRKAGRDVHSRYPEHVRLLTQPMANFFGLRSSGMKQVRGNGMLILTRSEIFFRMLLPSREFRIPLDSVTALKTPTSFLGRSKGRRLLQVDFTSFDGQEDSAAWLVEDPDRWDEMVRKTAGLD